MIFFNLQTQQKKMAKDLEKHGPYGSSEGEKWCLMLDHGGRISEVIIKSGSVIDSIAFTTIKPTDCGCGYSATHTKFGGNGGKPNLITFQCDEYITHFSGSLGQWDGQRVVAKMKIHTNLRPDGYGSYGNGDHVHNITNFESPPLSDGGVVGLFGTHSKYLHSIGVYGQKNQIIEKYGPYGSQCATNWSIMLEECESIKEVIIRHANIVDGIGFVILDAGGCNTIKNVIGGLGGKVSKVFL
ncbi:protein GOS9-like [Amaranthus tricolor]|uniref:protein GOS9-like n=1 Tax=Amaranthus tricolor TaxID=29722 RepID=UPI00258D4979|nr:protein GOS9-like [Amaranthus tricolor]